MTTRWYVRRPMDNRFLATGGFSAWGPNTIGWVERFQDATGFDHAYHALDVAHTFLPPGSYAVVDHFDHGPLPPDGNRAHVETTEERAARVQAEEAERLKVRKAWGIK